MTYGGTVPALTYTYTGLVNGDTSATFSGGLATTATSSSSVGSYPITLGTLAATGNYTIGTFNPGTLTVNAAPLIVTAANKSMTYGGTVPALTYTYTGLVNGDTSATFSGGLATTATSSSSVGGYSITEGTLAATGNYTIGTFNAGTLTVNRGTVDRDRCQRVDDLRRHRAGAGPTPIPVWSTATTSATFSGGLATTATSSSSVGGYAITQGTLAATGNYTIGTFNPGTLTVNAAPLSVTAANKSMTYGGTVPAPDLHLHRSGQRRHQRHVQRRPGDHGHVDEQRRWLRDHPGDTGCDGQLHDRHVQPGHADGERGTVERDRCQQVDDVRRHGAGADLHLHRSGQRRHQRHVQRRPGDHGHVDEQRGRLRDQPGDTGCDGQLHDRHV